MNLVRSIALIVASILVVPAISRAQTAATAATCTDGQQTVHGHCCWPGQQWSHHACTGAPHCPAGFSAQHNQCVRTSCPDGQAITEDTAGQCCWPSQVWSHERNACVGIPQCPSGYFAQGESCTQVSCPAGQAVSADTSGHCCWPGQAWSAERSACAGIPQCPTGMVAQGETCAQPTCQNGQVATADTAGHCCWPGQAWSQTRNACAGTPQCPQGLNAQGEDCSQAPVCQNGQVATAETAAHCCWPGQSWSAARAACAGTPQCPQGLTAQGETCAVACTNGQVSNADTAGHCCWPQQVWAVGSQRCAGVPACPMGMAASGDVCVAAASGAPGGGAAGTTATASAQHHGISPAGPVLLAIGAAVAIGGGIVWAINDSNYNTLRSNCLSGNCPIDANSTANQIRTLDIVSQAMIYGGAGVAVIGAVILVATMGHGGSEASSPPPSNVLGFDPVSRSVTFMHRF